MKTYKTFEFTDMPLTIRDLVRDRIRGQGSYLSYYPGDGYFKDPKEVTVVENSMEWEPNLNNYVYEKGDDPVGDWLIENGAELCEKVLILVDW